MYPLGVSGASLGHHLAMMRYVRTRFSPDFYIIKIVHNDFEDSLSRIDLTAFHAVRRAADSYEEVPPKKYQPLLSRRIIGHSTIMRYLIYIRLLYCLWMIASSWRSRATYTASRHTYHHGRNCLSNIYRLLLNWSIGDWYTQPAPASVCSMAIPASTAVTADS